MSFIENLKRVAQYSRTGVTKVAIDKVLTGQGAIHAMLSRSSQFKRLWDAEVRIYSQWGEDGILAYLCWSLDLVKPNVIEFGAGDFSECNSRFLAECFNANVVAVDALQELETNNLGNDLHWKTHFTTLVHWITPEQAAADLSYARNLLGVVDIISLDIDGNDYWVMENLDLDTVSIVVVEYNALFGSTASVTVPQNDKFSRSEAHFSNLYWGASLNAWISLMNGKGFSFVGTNLAGNNAFFIASNLTHKLSLTTPETTDLSIYTRWFVRESRNEQSELTKMSSRDCVSLIGHLQIYDTASHETYSVGELSL